MQAIYKYPIDPAKMSGSMLELEMPEGAKLLSVQLQRDTVCVWALVDIDAPNTTRKFAVVGTGWIVEPENNWTFLGTVQLHQGNLVFHVFDLGTAT